MTRVIAVQEGQLKMLKENYAKNVPLNINVGLSVGENVSVEPTNISNNANVLSESLSTPTMPSSVVSPSNQQIDMETQTVNLNPFEQQLGGETNPVNSAVTNEVFGTQINNTPSLGGENNVFNPNLNTTTVDEVNNNLPYQEPIMNNTQATTGSDDFYSDYIKDLNVLRDKLTTSYNEILSEIDKLQEKLNQKTGVQLLDSNDFTPENNNMVSNPVIDTPAVNIFDADKTFVTNDFRQEIAIARNEMEQGMNKVA